MKKTAFILAALLLIVFCGCDKDKKNEPESTNGTTAVVTTAEPAAPVPDN